MFYCEGDVDAVAHVYRSGSAQVEDGDHGCRWLSGNTLASDARGLSSTPGHGTLVNDSSSHPLRLLN